MKILKKTYAITYIWYSRLKKKGKNVREAAKMKKAIFLMAVTRPFTPPPPRA